MNRWVKASLITAAVSSVFVAVLLKYMMDVLTRAERIKIEQNPSDYGLEYESVAFPSDEAGLTLRGWYLRAPSSNRCIIMTHGGKSHRADPTIGMLSIAAGLVARGYNVLMFDLRGHGESDAGRMTGGATERSDLRGAIGFVEGQGIARENVGLLGFSLGAATSLLLAAEDKRIRAVVADSSWASLMDMVRSQIERRTSMPNQLAAVVPFLARKAYGVDLDGVKPLDAVGRIAPRPVLFIHGELDDVVPFDSSVRLHGACTSQGNCLWTVPDAGHVRSYLARPEEYIARVVEFFDRNLA